MIILIANFLEKLKRARILFKLILGSTIFRKKI